MRLCVERKVSVLSVANLTKQMKIGFQFGKNTSGNNLLHQLHKKERILSLMEIEITRTENIFRCTEAQLVRLLQTRRILHLFSCSGQNNTQHSVGGNNEEK